MNSQTILAPESLGERLRATRELTMALAEQMSMQAVQPLSWLRLWAHRRSL